MALLDTRSGFNAANDTTVSTDTGVTIPAGSLVVLKFTSQEGGTAVSAADSAGASYSVAVIGSGAAIFYKANHPGGTGVIGTVTCGAANRYKGAILEVWSAMETGASVFVDADYQAGSGVAAETEAFLAHQDSIVTGCVTASDNRDFAPVGGLTENFDQNQSGGVYSSASFYKAQARAALLTVRADANASAGSLYIAGASFRVARTGYRIRQVVEISADPSPAVTTRTTPDFRKPVAAGSLLHWLAFTYPSAAATATLTLSGQSVAAWVLEGTVEQDYAGGGTPAGGGDRFVAHWGHGRNAAGGSATGITVTASAAMPYLSLVVMEIEGLDTVAPWAAGQSAGNIYFPLTGTDTLTTAAPSTLSGLPACAIGWAENDNADPALQAGSAWNDAGAYIDWVTGSDATRFIRLEDKRITSGGPIGATFSNLGTNTATNLAGVSLYVEASSAPLLAQSRYRWRNDDGSETTATWAASENADLTAPRLETRRLRVQVQADGDPASSGYRLQYRRVGDSTWRDLQ